MSMFSDFAGGFVGGVKDVVDQNIANNMEMERYKKQLEVQEEMRKKAEEAKVAARRMFNVGGEQGPPQLMMEEYNSAGARIGNARPANPLEKESFAANQQAGAVDRINAADKQMWDLEQRQIKRDKADLDKRKGEQSIRNSKASEQYMRSGGGRNATPVDPFSTESDLSYLVSSKEGGEALDAAYQAELQKAFIAAKELKLGEAEVAATRRELARDYILKLKRLPDKSNKEESTSSFSAGGLTKE